MTNAKLPARARDDELEQPVDLRLRLAVDDDRRVRDEQGAEGLHDDNFARGASPAARDRSPERISGSFAAHERLVVARDLQKKSKIDLVAVHDSLVASKYDLEKSLSRSIVALFESIAALFEFIAARDDLVPSKCVRIFAREDFVFALCRSKK